MRLLKNKQFWKNTILIIIFTFLTCVIAKDIKDIISVSSMGQEPCIPIIMYHQVKNTELGKDVISPYEFEADLQYLTEHNYNTITMSQLIDYVYAGTELPNNPIILTFDDGYYSTYKYVFPLLKKYNMKIVLSIIGKAVDDYSKVVDHNVDYAHLTWDQIYEMEETGLVEVQNHTYNLHKISKGRYGCYQKKGEAFSEYEAILTSDITSLQDKITSVISNTPNTFTYPYGKYNNCTEAIIKELGFKASLSCEYGVNLIEREEADSLFGLKRICRAHNQPVKKIIKEGMETLKYINR